MHFPISKCTRPPLQAFASLQVMPPYQPIGVPWSYWEPPSHHSENLLTPCTVVGYSELWWYGYNEAGQHQEFSTAELASSWKTMMTLFYFLPSIERITSSSSSIYQKLHVSTITWLNLLTSTHLWQGNIYICRMSYGWCWALDDICNFCLHIFSPSVSVCQILILIVRRKYVVFTVGKQRFRLTNLPTYIYLKPLKSNVFPDIYHTCKFSLSKWN